jgi:hypothetical protein
VSSYPDLFRAIGTIYGGNGISKFKLPDFRGMFLRGTGGNAAPLGQHQGDAIRNLSGRFWGRGCEFDISEANGVFAKERCRDNLSAGHRGGATLQISFDVSRVVPTANENRPVNYAVNYYIKY